MAFLRDRSVFCIPELILSTRERYVIGSICMATSSVGFLGAALQIKSLWQYRNRQRRRPSPNPNIIFYLAVSDLIACIDLQISIVHNILEIRKKHWTEARMNLAGVFSLAICLMTFQKPEKLSKGYRPRHYSVYAPLGTAIEVVTLFSYLASYIWTLLYALDMCFQMHRIECSMVAYHILAWLIPFDFVAVIEGVNFGMDPDRCEHFHGRLSRLIMSYSPVMAVIFTNPILLLVTYRKIKQLLKSSGSYTVVDRGALNMCKKRFFWMVVAFTVCWFPNIISVTYDLITFNRSVEKSKLDKLWFIEAFLNPLQGMFNYFVYRHSFKVTATDTRPAENSLPRVLQVPSLERYTSDSIPSRAQRNIQRITDSSTNCEESPRRVIEAPPHVYISRLLGE